MGEMLEGSLITLMMLELDHIDYYLEQFSPCIQQLLHVKDIESERLYLTERYKQRAFFYLMYTHEHQLIGGIEIRNPGHLSQLYCWVNEQFWGNGYFQEAMRLAASAYYRTTHHSTISACIDITNSRSLRALEKVGFKKKGTRRGPHGLQFILQLHRDDIL